MDPYIVKSVYCHRFIANKETRIKYLSKFPTRKYTTFKNSMMPILPVDVIRYIMYIMIDTDKIELRLLMTESIYFYFGVRNLSIQFPSCHLTYEEMHEAMVVKLFAIILMIIDIHLIDIIIVMYVKLYQILLSKMFNYVIYVYID